jgi:hypothetical protein
MKKLTLLFLLITGGYTAHAQTPGTVTVETAEHFTAHQPIVATAAFVPSSTTNPATSHTWEITMCDEHGNYTGDPLFSESYSGAPGYFEFPGSEDFPEDQHYRIDIFVEDGQHQLSSSSAVTLSVAFGITGPGSTIAAPGEFVSSTSHTINIPNGTYKYQVTFQGVQFISSFKITVGNPPGILPGVQFGSTGISQTFSFEYQVSPTAPTCFDANILVEVLDGTNTIVCAKSYVVRCMEKTDVTLVRMNSGIYYQGDDHRIHRMYWAGGTWNYQAITPSNNPNWTGVQADGWLSGNFTTDIIFFKGKDGKPYRLDVGNPTTLTTIGGVSNVKSDLELRSPDQMIYIGTDSKVYKMDLNIGTGVWTSSVINPSGGYQGNGAQALAREGNTNGNIYFHTANGQIFGLWLNAGTTPWTWQLVPMLSPSPSVPGCNGDMLYDDPGQVLYYKGSDNYIHRVRWDIPTSQWVYEAMTPINAAIPATNSLTHIQGTNSITFKGSGNRVYHTSLINGSWQTNWLVGNYTNVAGDLACDWTSIYFISRNPRQVCSYWYSGTGWGVGPFNNAPGNAVGCSSLFRMAAPRGTYPTENFSVHPNPSNGAFQISFSNPVVNTTGELYNLLGESVEAFTFSGATYNYSPATAIAPGVYLLRVTSNGNTESRQLVIQ